MVGLGTSEDWFEEDMTKSMGERAIALHFRRPLSLDEVNRMQPTPEVRARPGRP